MATSKKTFALANYDDVLTISQAAQAIKASTDLIHRLASAGKIRKFNVSTRRVVIPKVDLIAYLEECLASADTRPAHFNPNVKSKKTGRE